MGGHWGFKDELRIRRIRFRRLTSLETGGMGQKANYSQKANGKHRKRCQSLDISQLLEDRHSARGPAEVLR